MELDDNAPLPPAGPQRFVRRVRGTEKFTFTVLSRAWWSVWTHWDGRRSHPHYKAAKQCPGCKAGWPKRWKGYLHVWNDSQKQNEFLEITPDAAKQLEVLIAPAKNFRGNRIVVERGRGDKARLRIALLSHHSQIGNAKELAQEEDPKPTLMELWGLNDVSFGDDNDTPKAFDKTA